MDDKSLKAAIEVTTAVAKESYSDVGRPILKPTGETVGLIPRAIKAALLPIEKWILNKEHNLAEIERLLELKLQNVKPEQIMAPEAYIGVPALQYLSYCMDSKELRDMYAELLAKSMNEVTRNGVHPSYVEIIKQLCPDEAKILRAIDLDLPVISLRYEKSNGSGLTVLNNFSDIGYKTSCEYPDYIPQYIDNMERLGLIFTTFGSALVDKTRYDRIKKHKFIKNFQQKYLSSSNVTVKEGYSMKQNEGVYYLTHYGMSFKSTCTSSINEANYLT